MACNTSLHLIQGDTLQMAVTMRNSDLTPINLTGATVKMTIAKDTVVYSGTLTITDAVNGVCQVNIPKETTNLIQVGEYVWEIQILGSSGDMTTTPRQKIFIDPQLTPNV